MYLIMMVMNSKPFAVMKKLLKSLMLFAAAAMALTSCENEAMNEGIEANDTVTMTFVAGAPESKTAVSINDNVPTFTWSTGDKVGFYYVDVEGTGKKKKNSGAAVIGEKETTATFTLTLEAVDKITGASAYNVGAFYPGPSWVSHADADPFNNVKVKINAGQSLTEGTFDPTADLMIAKPFMDIALESSNTKTLEFHRIAAIGKMNLKLDGMESGEIIKSVKFSLAEGTHFTGPVFLDMEKQTYTLGTEDTSNAVTLSGELAANAERTEIFFTCFPGEYSGTYTIDVETDKATYKKAATLSKALSFTEGNVLSFNATVGNRDVEVVEEGETVDVLNRASTSATDQNYKDWTFTGTSGAVYKGQSAGSNSSIQLRSNNNNSGIVTTTSGGTVKKVAVTWNNSTSNGRTLIIYGKNSAYTAATDLYDTNEQGTELGTIVCGTSTELEIEGDYTHIGLRSKSGAMYLTEIEITWAGAGQGGETPEPDKPATPVELVMSNVTCSAQTETSLTFTWTAVENAIAYQVYFDGVDKGTTKDLTYTATGLTAGTIHTIAVKAVGDGTNYTTSSTAKTAQGTTETAQQGGEGGDETSTFTETFANYSPSSNATTYALSGNFAGASESGITWAYTGCGNPTQTKTDINSLVNKGMASGATGITMGKNGTLSATIPGDVTSVSLYVLTSSKATCTVTITNGSSTKTQTIAKSTTGKVDITGITGNSGSTTISFKEASGQNRVTIGSLTYTK